MKSSEYIDGVYYDTVTYSGNFEAYTHDSIRCDTSAENSKLLSMQYGAYAKFNTVLSRASKTLFWYRAKNGTLYVNVSQKIYHSVPDKKNKETTTYSDRVEISYSESRYSSTTVKLNANTDGLCRDARYRLNDYTVYYPRYTITMESANPTLQGKKYTAEGKSTNINVPALSSKSSSWRSSQTVSGNGSVSLSPGTLTQGVKVARYEFYIGSTKVYTITSGSIYYSDLNSIRERYASNLKSNKYKLVVKPVYEVQSANVTFKTQDPDTVAFKGANETYTVYYYDPGLAVQYTPEEVNSPNSNAGAVNIFLYDDPSKTIGASTAKTPFKIPDANNKYDLSGMNFTTRTLRTYVDPVSKKNISVYGNSYVFQPYYADTVINYHHKAVQDDEAMEGVKGYYLH